MQPQTLPKTASKAQKSKPKLKKLEPVAELVVKKVDEGSGSESNEENGDEDDIDDAGMKRIIELLGDDGLDEFAQYQLGVLGGQGSEEENHEIESDEESSDVQEGGGSENGASDGPSKDDEDIGDDEDDDIAVTQDAVDSEIDLEGLSEVDEDAVPHQRLKYMNDVWTFISVGRKWAYIPIPRTLWSEYGKT